MTLSVMVSHVTRVLASDLRRSRKHRVHECQAKHGRHRAADRRTSRTGCDAMSRGSASAGCTRVTGHQQVHCRRLVIRLGNAIAAQTSEWPVVNCLLRERVGVD